MKDIDRSEKHKTKPHKKDLHPGIYLHTFSRVINSLSSNKYTYINNNAKYINALIRYIQGWRRRWQADLTFETWFSWKIYKVLKIEYSVGCTNHNKKKKQIFCWYHVKKLQIN